MKTAKSDSLLGTGLQWHSPRLLYVSGSTNNANLIEIIYHAIVFDYLP